MIETMRVKKSFDGVAAVNDVSLQIREKEVFGLVGTNGAGKSTLLRMIAGVIRQDEGTILLDNENVYDNPEAKRKLFFIPDEPYFFPNSTIPQMEGYYRQLYPTFDSSQFGKLTDDFGLDRKRKIDRFSKGMKKQLSILLGICSGTKYLLCDETFDGLDPVMRQAVKSLFAKHMEDRGLTPVLTSHNLRELEDICDHMGLLHEGGVILSQDIETMKLSIQKVQCVFAAGIDPDKAMEGMDIMAHSTRGRLHTVTVRGSREAVQERFRNMQTIFFEILSPSLEEIFISETEVAGYDIRKIITE